MLVKLTGEQVSRHWIDTIKPAIANSLPEYVVLAENTMNNILTQILSDVLHCWVVMDGDRVVGVCTTMVTVDPISQSSAYLIYSLHNLEGTSFPDELWDACLVQTMKTAKSYGCNTVYCYTDVDQIAIKAEQTGGAFVQQLITFPLPE
jgi:hypothetical protein